MMSLTPLPGIRFGAAYYAEYEPDVDLGLDFDRMKAAGFTVIRVGESVWSTWEPTDGVFNLEWLEPVLDAAHARGIAVILGTPTYAVPPWLQVAHPEIAAESSTGVRVPWGTRQEVDYSQPAFRFYAERVIRKVIGRYAKHPAVVGYQVDNEPGLRLPHNDSTFRAFLGWLKAKYGSVDRLNADWGLVYWSHRLSDWAELWRPDGNLMPQYDLEWRRFQASLATDFISWQAQLVREYSSDGQFVTTCLSYSRPQIQDDLLMESLDVVAGNPYYRMQDGLTFGQPITRPTLWWHTGVPALFQWADRAWGTAQAPFLVTETNAQSIGAQSQSYPPFPGQIRQAAFSLISRGARMIEYWQWQTLRYGAETYWGGVLPHSGQPGRIYAEVAQLGSALERIGTTLDGYVPVSDVGMLFSTETGWAFEFEPPLTNAAGETDPTSYQRIFDAFYQGLFEVGAQVRIQNPRAFLHADPAQLAHDIPVLLAPALYIADDALLDHLLAYAHAGGHMVLGMKTGYGDELARARKASAPDRLASATGVHYDEYSNLDASLEVHSASADFTLEPGSAGTSWVDILHVDHADTVLAFEPSELGAGAALTTTTYGSGRISYVATVPNAELARSLGRWLVPRTAAARWQVGTSVTVSTGATPGGRFVFLFNWSGHHSHVVAPVAVCDPTTGKTHDAGATIPLLPRASLLLEECTPSPSRIASD